MPKATELKTRREACTICRCYSRTGFVQLQDNMPNALFEVLRFLPLRVQVPINHTLTQNQYYNYYYPNPRYPIIGYSGPLGTVVLLGTFRPSPKLNPLKPESRAKHEAFPEHQCWGFLNFNVGFLNVAASDPKP